MPVPGLLFTSEIFRYGLCRRVDELKICDNGEDAEQILIDPYNFAGQSYTRVSYFYHSNHHFEHHFNVVKQAFTGLNIFSCFLLED